MKEEFDKLLSNYSDAVQLIAGELRDLILELYPDTYEKIHFGWKIANYSLGGTKVDNFCYIMPKKDNCSIGFPRATELKDEELRLEGTGKLHRHLKITDIKEVRSDYIIDLINQAAIIAMEDNNA